MKYVIIVVKNILKGGLLDGDKVSWLMVMTVDGCVC